MKWTLVAFVLMCGTAQAHSWYSHRSDPVSHYGCCGGHDCNVLNIKPHTLTPEGDGYRVRLTLEEARAINPQAMFPVDAYVPRERIQDSETNDYNICIYNSNRTAPYYGVICFFEPPST